MEVQNTCYEIDNVKSSLMTLNTINNTKLYILYEMGKQSLYTIMNYIFNDFKYQCNDFKDINDFKFSINNTPIEITKDPQETIKLLSVSKEVKMNLANNSGSWICPNIKYDPSKFIEQPDTFGMFVKQLSGRSIHLHFNPSKVTTYELMMRIQEMEGVPPDQQRLIYNGRQLELERLLSDYNVQAEQSFMLVLRLRGGMYNEVSGRNGAYQPLKSVFIDLIGYKESQ